jgi:hypothetical protein
VAARRLPRVAQSAAVEAGYAVHEIAAISYATLSKVTRYTKATDQRRLARAAMARAAAREQTEGNVSKPSRPKMIKRNAGPILD